jgi:hypothetical protein
MRSRVGAAGAPGIAAEAPGHVLGAVEEHPLAVAGRARPETFEAGIADRLGKGHEHVDDHVVVEPGSGIGPMNVEGRAVVFLNRRGDSIGGECLVQSGNRSAQLGIGEGMDQRGNGAKPALDIVDLAVAGRCGPEVLMLDEDLPGTLPTAAVGERVGKLDSVLDRHSDFRVDRVCGDVHSDPL